VSPSGEVIAGKTISHFLTFEQKSTEFAQGQELQTTFQVIKSPQEYSQFVVTCFGVQTQ
jgi:hypothetical protein